MFRGFLMQRAIYTLLYNCQAKQVYDFLVEFIYLTYEKHTLEFFN